jgi:manganese transport protein
MKRLLSILFWSIIAAAFIGPGTVTTAASAGAAHGYALVWALGFSVLATLVLMEAATRLTIVSGRNLAEAIREQFSGGPSGLLVLLLVLGAIVVGNAAYEAGNILGAVAGVQLGAEVAPWAATLVIGLVSGALLWLGTPRTVAHILSVTVAAMGVAFLVTAVSLRPDAGELVASLLIPSTPAGSGLLILALVGTTVVPYNLFLGSGLAEGRELGEVRFGLAIAVLLGGLVSMGVLVVGSAVDGPFTFEALADALALRLGPWAGALLALGLFAAGFSSATTAPLAAAVTARGLFEDGSGRWEDRAWRYRAVWGGILLVGVGFGVAGVRPIPAIILAQALNGILLPFAAVFLLVAINDGRLMKEGTLNGPISNTLMVIVTAVAVLLGTSGILRAAFTTFGAGAPDERHILGAGALVVVLLIQPVGSRIRARRNA